MATESTLIYGIHAVQAAVVQGRAVQLWVDGARQDKRMRALRAALGDVPCHAVERQQLDLMIPNVNHQGVVAECKTDRAYHEEDLPALVATVSGPPLLLVMDGIQDPHNLGACLRCAAGVGVDAVIAPRDRAVGLTPAVRKVASGAAEIVPFLQVANLARTLRSLQTQGVWIVGTTTAAERTIYELDLTVPLALVMGAEERGLRRLTADHCDFLAQIPLSGAIQSLNVAVATGVCLFETLRQRRYARR